MAAAQLSLFADSDETNDVPRRKRRAGQPRSQRLPALVEVSSLFAGPLPEVTQETGPASVDTAPIRAVGTPDPEPEPPPDDRETAPCADEADASLPEEGRIRFDAAVWQLQSESGDFVNIRTGDVRGEDDFQFVSAGIEALDDEFDDWDIAQVIDDEA